MIVWLIMFCIVLTFFFYNTNNLTLISACQHPLKDYLLFFTTKTKYVILPYSM